MEHTPRRRSLRRCKHELSPTLPDSRQNLISVEPEKTRLILSRRMKDQVSEAKLNVEPNLLHMLIGIIRDKPPAMRLVGNGRGL